MSEPFVHVHRVRFEEVDAAGLAYFAHFFTWCHDAMAEMLAPLEGGYVALVAKRRLGLPAVHIEADFASPLRYGDEVRVGVCVERLGTSSVTLRYQLDRLVGAPAGSPERLSARPVATIRHVVALTDLDVLRAKPLTADLRALLERHVVAGDPSSPPS